MIPLFWSSSDVICCTYIVLCGVQHSMLFTLGPGVAAVVFALFISSRMGKGCTTSYTLSAEKNGFFNVYTPKYICWVTKREDFVVALPAFRR